MGNRTASRGCWPGCANAYNIGLDDDQPRKDAAPPQETRMNPYAATLLVAGLVPAAPAPKDEDDAKP